MACFLVPMGIAVITTIIQKLFKRVAEKLKLYVLNAFLWGGSILLCAEHIFHGEVVPWPPFLTAMATPAEIPVMLYEMTTIGTAMTVAILATWGMTLWMTYIVLPILQSRYIGALERATKLGGPGRR